MMTPIEPAEQPSPEPQDHTSCCRGHVCWGGGEQHPHQHRLTVSDLVVSYRSVKALERVSFSTSCGRSLALIGPNGAGKSTLLKTLAGLISPESGQVLWRGQSLVKSSHELAYLPQRGDIDWDFPITVRGLVEMGRYPNLSWWRRFGPHDRQMVDHALETMALQDLCHRQIRELSGGQQQRAFIARALAQEAHVLLLDEPFGGLDQPATELLQRLFGELVKEGRLLISSHHELDTVVSLFDDVLLLHRRVMAFGPVREAFTPEALALTYGRKISLSLHS